MLAGLQEKLAERTNGAAIRAVPPIPPLEGAPDETVKFVAQVTEQLQKAVADGKSTFVLLLAKRNKCRDDVEWGDCYWYFNYDIDNTGRDADPIIPASFVQWWRHHAHRVRPPYDLPEATKKIGRQRLDNFLYDYVATQLARVWLHHSDVPVRVLNTKTSTYHPGNCYGQRPYTEHVERLGLTFDWSPQHQSPEMTLALARVAKCETKLSAARAVLNRLIEESSSTNTAPEPHSKKLNSSPI